ncbi:unnamed protein product [Lathyrus oleraceus]
MNKTCISKFGWKLQNNNGEFWCDVVWGKYDRNDNRRDISVKPTNSSLWKSIVKVWPKIDKYSMWSVGDGRGVNAWNDVWIAPNGRVADLQIVIPMHMKNEKVADIAHVDAGWKREELNNWVSMNMLQ